MAKVNPFITDPTIFESINAQGLSFLILLSEEMKFVPFKGWVRFRVIIGAGRLRTGRGIHDISYMRVLMLWAD